MKNKYLIIIVVLLTGWNSILYAETYNFPFYQYLVDQFFQDKTENFIKKYQTEDNKGTVQAAYLPLTDALTIQTPAEQSESMVIFNKALSDYLAVITESTPSIKRVSIKKDKYAIIAKILVIDNDLITPIEKIQRLKTLIKSKLDVIITGHYLEKPEDKTLKVRLTVVSTKRQSIEKQVIIFNTDKFICSISQDDKALCRNAYKKMITAINGIIFEKEDNDSAANITPSATVVDENDNDTSQTTSNLIDENIGILPFSRLASTSVQNKIGNYYYDLENEFINTFKQKEFLVKLVEYPENQQRFTYEGMTAPPFDIDPDDFATPEQILLNICENNNLDKVIFGHLEEISDSLYLVARVYSKSNHQIMSVQPIDKILINELKIEDIKIALNKLTMKIIELLA